MAIFSILKEFQNRQQIQSILLEVMIVRGQFGGIIS